MAIFISMKKLVNVENHEKQSAKIENIWIG